MEDNRQEGICLAVAVSQYKKHCKNGSWYAGRVAGSQRSHGYSYPISMPHSRSYCGIVSPSMEWGFYMAR